MPLMLDPPIYESATETELRAWLDALHDMRTDVPGADTRAHAALDRSEQETRAELAVRSHAVGGSHRDTEAQR